MNQEQNKRILIAGGYGLVGSTIARHIRSLHKDVELLIAGRNPEVGAQLAAELGNAKSVYLDVNKGLDNKGIGNIDLIIAALQDHSDSLIHYAMSHGAAHIGITKLADEIAPVTFHALKNPPARPIVVLGHWQAGVLITVAQKLAEQFNKIHKVEATGYYDPADPIGVMVQNELENFIGRALIREQGNWKWVDSTKYERELIVSEEIKVLGYPMGTIDVPSLAAITSAENVRFDFAQGTSIGTLEGGKASHDLYIDFEGKLKSGEQSKKGVIVSDPNGSSHLTALGVLVATERVLGLDGEPAAAGRIYTPETLLNPDQAITRFKQFGVKINFSDTLSHHHTQKITTI